VRELADKDAKEVAIEEVQVFLLTSEQRQSFESLSIEGSKDSGRVELLLETLALIAILREDTSLYMATVDGKFAKSAGMAFINTSKGNVAQLYIDSTLQGYRGRGVQKALLKARLADARKAGFNMASCGSVPT
jgi:predicted GNAT family acetyltransferase